jgi:SAM-dependent methyltransferase
MKGNMRTTIKKILSALGIIEKVRLVYNSTKSVSLDILREEIQYRKKNMPDGYPAPPKELIFLIIGLRWSSIYFNSGNVIFKEMKSLFTKNKIDINSFGKVLDFGCGCGRIIRHFNSNSNNVQLYGCDYNEGLINWCKDNLTFGSFTTNKLAPPSDYEDSFFDLIYARSVFTHLSDELQKLWIEEFKRVIKTGGYLYITTHGENTFHNLTHEEQAALRKEGILTVNSIIEGNNKCTTYQTRDFTEKKFSGGFEIVTFLPGKNNSTSPQDIYILKRN